MDPFFHGGGGPRAPLSEILETTLLYDADNVDSRC